MAEQHAVASIAREIRRSAPGEKVVRLDRARGRRVSTRATVIAFAAVLASGTAAAAAANGSLPPGVQRAVSSALSHVNISVPHPAQHHPPHPVVSSSDDAHDGSVPANAGHPGATPTGRTANDGGNNGNSKPNGNATHTSPSTPARGNGNNTTHTTPPNANNGNGNTPTTVAKGNRNNTTHTTPSNANNGTSNGKANGNTTQTTSTTPATGNGNGNGKSTTTHTTPPNANSGTDNGQRDGPEALAADRV